MTMCGRERMHKSKICRRPSSGSPALSESPTMLFLSTLAVDEKSQRHRREISELSPVKDKSLAALVVGV